MIVFMVVLNVLDMNILVAGAAGILATCILFPKTIGGPERFLESVHQRF